MVVTRSLEEDISISRVRILRSIREIFSDNYATTVFRVRNVIDARSVGNWISACKMAVSGILSLKPAPLQCCLYGATGETSRLAREIAAGGYDVVYLDSVRCLGLLRALVKNGCNARVVVDFDDLMSRRMEMIAGNRWPVSLGYLQQKIPPILRKAAEGLLSGVISYYEARALRCAEREMCQRAQAVVLVSPAERDLLRRRLGGRSHLNVHSVIPSRRSERNVLCVKAPYRFVFIGSDVHGQNRLSLEYLVDLWRRNRPGAPLHVYGKQVSCWPALPNVYWHGYVDDLAEVYSDDSISLLPVLRAGGIKTKMIEAWAYGRPVLANPAAFEGLDVRGYPLVVPEEEWGPYIMSPEMHRDSWLRAAEVGNLFVKEELSQERYVSQWLRIMRPDGDGRSHINDARAGGVNY